MAVPARFSFAYVLVAALGFLPALAAAQEMDWGVYRDRDHGCRLDFPRALFSPDPEEPGQPQRFSSTDENTYFRVMGAENRAGWTPEDIKEKYLSADMPGDITYERTRGEFLVLSGYREGKIFYTKVAVSNDGRTACILDITYPRPLKRRFDGIVTRMSRSFSASP